MIQSYSTIVSALRQFSEAHLNTQRFKCSFVEQLDNFSTEEKSFPILFAVPDSVGLEENIDSFNFRVYCLDILQKDRSNEPAIMNSTLLVLTDLANWLRLDDTNELNLLNNPIATPVNNALMEGTCGWFFDIEIEANAERNSCSIPYSDAFQLTGITVDVQTIHRFLTCDTLELCSHYIDIVNNSVNTISLSAGTIYSGATNLYDIFSIDPPALPFREIAFGSITSGLTSDSNFKWDNLSIAMSIGNGGLYSENYTQLKSPEIQTGEFSGTNYYFNQETDINGNAFGDPAGGIAMQIDTTSPGGLIIGTRLYDSPLWFGTNNTIIASANTTGWNFETPILSAGTNLYDIFSNGGSATLNPTYIGYGNSSSVLTGSSNITFTDRYLGNANAGFLDIAGLQLSNYLQQNHRIYSTLGYLEITSGNLLNFYQTPKTIFDGTVYVGQYGAPASNYYFEVSGTSKFQGITANTITASTTQTDALTAGTTYIKSNEARPFSVQSNSGDDFLYYDNSSSVYRTFYIRNPTYGSYIALGFIGGTTYLQPAIGSNFTIYGANSASSTAFNADGTIISAGAWKISNLSATTLSASTIQSDSLAGSGDRMVVADSNGLLSTQAIPSGSGSLNPTQVGYGNSSSGLTGTTGITYNSASEIHNTTSGFRINSLTGGTKFEVYQPNRTAGFNAAFSILTSEAGTNGGTTATTNSRVSTSRLNVYTDSAGVYLSTGLDAANGIGTTSGDLVIQAATNILRANASGLQLGTSSRPIGNIYIGNSTSIIQTAGSTGVHTLQLGATRDDGAANKTAYLIKGASAYTTTHYLSVTDNQNNTMFTIAPDGKTGIALGGVGTAVGVPTAFLDVRNSSANTASFRIRSGSTVPSSPNDGDVWNDGSHLFGKFGGEVRYIDNYLPAGQVGYGSATSGLTGNTSFTYNSTAGYLTTNLSAITLTASTIYFNTSANSEIEFKGGGVANIYHSTAAQAITVTANNGPIYFSTDNYGSYLFNLVGTSALLNGDFRSNSLTASTISGDSIYGGQITARSNGSPLIVDSLNSNSGKIAFRDAGTLRSYFGADASNLLSFFTPAGDSQFNIATNGDIYFASLTGATTRMVVANAAGVLSTQTIPSGSGSSVTINPTQIAFGDSSSALTSNSRFIHAPTSTSSKFEFRDWVGIADYPTIYLLGSGTTASISNYALTSDGPNTYLNAPTGSVKLRTSGGQRVDISDTQVTVSAGLYAYSARTNELSATTVNSTTVNSTAASAGNSPFYFDNAGGAVLAWIHSGGNNYLSLNNSSNPATTKGVANLPSNTCLVDPSEVGLYIGGSGVFAVSANASYTSINNVRTNTLTANTVSASTIYTQNTGYIDLAGGSVVVNTTKITANSNIFLSYNSNSLTNIGVLAEDKSARVAGTSFKIVSSNPADTSTVAWFIIEPSA